MHVRLEETQVSSGEGVDITHLGRDVWEQRGPGRRHLCNSVATHSRRPCSRWNMRAISLFPGELISQGAAGCRLSSLPRLSSRAPNYWIHRKVISKGKLYWEREKEYFFQGTQRVDNIILWSENNCILMTAAWSGKARFVQSEPIRGFAPAPLTVSVSSQSSRDQQRQRIIFKLKGKVAQNSQ